MKGKSAIAEGLALVVAVALTGCLGGDEDGAATPTTVRALERAA